MAANALIRVRRDTAANWTSANPVLVLGEIGFETDTRKIKVGDGTTAWASLSYMSAAASITSSDVTTALGYTPYNATNPSAYISGITGGMVTTALGYTPTSVTGLTGVQSIAAFKTGLTLVKADVGLGSVDNTADAAKNVLSATKLTTPRTINGTSFDGTGNITINAVDATARVPTTRLINTTAPLTGGGDLSADRTLAISAATTLAAGSMSAADKTKLDAITGTNTGDQTITLTGPVTGSGTGSFATTIASGAVGLSQMANVASGTVFYRKTAAAGPPEVQTLATLKTDLALTKSDVGLSNVDNTSDVNKPVSTAQATALALKLDRSYNQGNLTNTPVLTISNIGAGLSTFNLTLAAGGSADIWGTSGNRWFSQFLNRTVRWNVNNSAFDSAAEAFSMENQGADTRHVMTLNQLSGTATGDFLRCDLAGVNKFRIDKDGTIVTATLVDATYTPTVANVVNAGTVTLNSAFYTRLGKTIHVSLSVSITPTATATDTQISITLPVAFDVLATKDIIGTGASVDSTGPSCGVISGGATNDWAVYRFKSTGTTSKEHMISFRYRVP